MSEELSQHAGQQRPKREKISKEALERIPHTSYWPFALAFAIIVMLLGVVIHPILFFIGVALTVVTVIGLGLERR